MDNKPKITFIARQYPPNPNINGESVCDMVSYLEEHFGIYSNVLSIDKELDGGQGKNRVPVGNVIRLKPLFKDGNKITRILNFLWEGYKLVQYSKKFKDTFIVVTSSPPLLPFWASILYNKQIRWSYWALDLFPEAFHAAGVIKKESIFYRWIYNRTYKATPSHIIALGNQQAAHIKTLFKKEIPTSILPCGVFFYQDKSDEKPAWYQADKITFGYCGNVHDAHNPDFIKAIIDQINPDKHQIILALYGDKAPDLIAYAQGKPGVVLVKSVPRNQLHFIDVHLVSLMVKWAHIAVPSKAVSAITMGCPILFCGSKESDNWDMFKEAGWFIDEEADIPTQAKKLVAGLTLEEVQQKKDKTEAIYTQLKQHVLDTYKEVADLSI